MLYNLFAQKEQTKKREKLFDANKASYGGGLIQVRDWEVKYQVKKYIL